MFPDERQPVFSEFESYMMAGGLRKFYLEILETNLCMIFIKIFFSVLTQNWKLGILTWLTSLFLSRSLPFSSFSSRTQLSGKVFFSTNKTFFFNLIENEPAATDVIFWVEKCYEPDSTSTTRPNSITGSSRNRNTSSASTPSSSTLDCGCCWQECWDWFSKEELKLSCCLQS